MGYRPKSARQHLTAGDQTAQDGFAHVAAADKTDFLLHHASPFLCVVVYDR
jgi:hypothetical protein